VLRGVVRHWPRCARRSSPPGNSRST
jgi:hypothetical protein